MPDLFEADKLGAIELAADRALHQYGLYEQGWRFEWDNAVTRFGSCGWADKRITVSKKLAELNELKQGIDTVLHEVAHAIAGENAGHNRAWKRVCRMIGATPRRCYEGDVVTPPSPYVEYCPSCYESWPRFRRRRGTAACIRCCRHFNGGRYSRKFELRLVPREHYVGTLFG